MHYIYIQQGAMVDLVLDTPGAPVAVTVAGIMMGLLRCISFNMYALAFM